MSEVLVNFSHSSELSPGTLPPSIKWMWLSGCSQQGREVRQRSAIRSQTVQQTQEGLGRPSVRPQPCPPRLYFSPPTPGWALGRQEVKWKDVCSVLKELVDGRRDALLQGSLLVGLSRSTGQGRPSSG